jgi:hypothetical protein
VLLGARQPAAAGDVAQALPHHAVALETTADMTTADAALSPQHSADGGEAASPVPCRAGKSREKFF